MVVKRLQFLLKLLLKVETKTIIEAVLVHLEITWSQNLLIFNYPRTSTVCGYNRTLSQSNLDSNLRVMLFTFQSFSLVNILLPLRKEREPESGRGTEFLLQEHALRNADTSDVPFLG